MGGVTGGVIAVLVLTVCITVALCCCVKRRQSKYLVEHEQSSKMELDTVPKKRTNTYEGISYKNLTEDVEEIEDEP